MEPLKEWKKAIFSNIDGPSEVNEVSEVTERSQTEKEKQSQTEKEKQSQTEKEKHYMTSFVGGI